MDMEEEVDASVTAWGELGLRLRLADRSFSLSLTFLASLLSLLSRPTYLACRECGCKYHRSLHCRCCKCQVWF